ncbi:MAG: bamA [Devosia sp.]|nr:bamA [Devosia sp.]
MAILLLGLNRARIMMASPRLLRGVFMALALMLAAPLAGIGGSILGATPVMAQQDPLVASVLFEGNTRFSDAQLLTMVDVSSRGTYNAARIATDVESIRLAYDGAGFLGVQVSPRAETLENGRVLVTFTVNEGQRAAIKAINFTGNNAFNSGTLKGILLTKETGILSFLLRDDTYDEQKVAVDRELIRNYYMNNGYPDAQVTSVADYDATRNAYFINFTITEGDLYTFGGVTIETSIDGLNADALRGLVQTPEGSRYSQDDLTTSSEELAIEATAQGFAFADVRPRLNRDAATRTFSVAYLVDQGPRIYVQRINITGNEKTRDFVIRRELEFGEGDPFNRSLVSRGRASIQALGFFESVQVTAEPGTAADQVVINIAVVEQATGEYGATAGFSTQDGLLGELSLTERNFLGRGQYLRAAVGLTQAGRTFDFSFTEPKFMGLDIAAGIDIYHRINGETESRYYGFTATGGQLRFGIPITSQINGTLFAGFETKTIEDKPPFDEDSDPTTPDVNYGPESSLVDNGEVYNKAFVGYTLGFSTLDDPKRPRNGFLGSFTQQYMHGFDRYGLLKTEARGRYFVSLLEDFGVVGSVRGQAGIVNSLDGSAVPAIEAFGLGPSIVRGFEFNGFGPRLTSGEALGATLYAAASAEIEFPIPVLPESYGLRGAVWADVGWVGDGTPGTGSGTIDPASVEDPIRASLGASLIWDSPFGPLRGDFAYPLMYVEGVDKPQLFQFTISSLF